MCNEVLKLGHELLLFCRDMWAPAINQRHYCCVTVVSIGSATREEIIVCLLLQLLHQPGENTAMAGVSARERLCSVRLCYGCCYCCCISQERINVSAVLWLLQPSSSLLAHAFVHLISFPSHGLCLVNSYLSISPVHKSLLLWGLFKPEVISLFSMSCTIHCYKHVVL